MTPSGGGGGVSIIEKKSLIVKNFMRKDHVASMASMS